MVGVATALVLTGCATVQQGSPARDPNADPHIVNTALLDPGRFPTEPREALGTPNNEDSAKLVEARRMGDVVVLPFEIDGTLLSMQSASGPTRNPRSLSGSIYFTVLTGIADHGFVTAFLSEGGTASYSTTMLSNLVLRFPTPEDAEAAAAGMVDRALAAEGSDGARQFELLPVPERPDATFLQDIDSSYPRAYAFSAHGPFVLALIGKDSQIENSKKRMYSLLDKQKEALDEFTPTPVDQLMSLDVDPPGLLARTLPSPPNARDAEKLGLFTPHAVLNFSDNPVRDEKLFAKTGLEWAAFGQAAVYQVRDAKAAAELAEEWGKDKAAAGYSRADQISGMPDARCQLSPASEYSTSKPRSYHCVATADRYVIEVVSGSEYEAHQKVAAQYMMLKSS